MITNKFDVWIGYNILEPDTRKGFLCFRARCLGSEVNGNAGELKVNVHWNTEVLCNLNA